MNGKKVYAAIRCAYNPSSTLNWVEKSSQDQTYSSHSDTGHWTSCPTDTLPTAIKFADGHTYLTCSAISGTSNTQPVQVDYDSATSKPICHSGSASLLSCPEGYTMSSICAADSDNGKCQTSQCATKSKDTNFGMQCVKMAGYELNTVADVTASPSGNETTYEVIPGNYCQVYKTFANTDVTYNMKNTIEHQSSVTNEVTQKTTSGKSVTDSLNEQTTIQTKKRGLPIGTLTASQSFGYGHSVTTTFEQSQSYSNQQYNSETRTLEVDETLTLAKDYQWAIVSFGLSISATANYEPVYYEYLPGAKVPNDTTETMFTVNEDMSGSSYLLALSSEYYDANYLKFNDCLTIASDYMYGTGAFSGTPDSENTVNGNKGDEITQAGSPAAFGNNGNRKKARFLRG